MSETITHTSDLPATCLETAESPELIPEDPLMEYLDPDLTQTFQDMHASDVQGMEEIRTQGLIEDLEGQEKNPSSNEFIPSSFYNERVDPTLKRFLPSWCVDDRNYIYQFQGGLFAVTEATIDHPLTSTAHIVYSKPNLEDEELMMFSSHTQFAIEAFPKLATEDMGEFGPLLQPGDIVTTVTIPPANEYEQTKIIIYVHPGPHMMMTFPIPEEQDLETAAA